MKKTAEHATTDGGKFPVESCRERLARKWGLDAVTLSGPCEGRPLCECVCEQLDSRWDRLKDRFAGNTDKVVRLASKLAESYMRKDDLKQCENDLSKMGFNKEAAHGIAGYLKAYAMDEAAEEEIDEISEASASPEADDLVEDEPASEVEDLGEDLGKGLEDEAASEVENLGEDLGEGLEAPVEDEMDEEAPAEELPSVEEPVLDLPTETEGLGEPAGETVVIEIPKEVALELDEFLDKALGEHEEPAEEVGLDVSSTDLPPAPEAEGEEPAALDVEVIELPLEAPKPEEEKPVPGELAEEESPVPSDKQFVTGEPEVEKACGPGCGKKAEEGRKEEDGRCPVCGKQTEPEKKEEKKEEEKACGANCGKKEEPEKKAGSVGVDKYAEATKNMRSGHLNSVKFSWLNKFADEQMLKLGPEMSINNTDQLSKGKPMGNAKEKAVEDPKPLSEGNVHPEGHTAGGNKFQDGKTMGREERFDAASVKISDVSKGDASLMGKNESLPKDGPSVPSQETPLMTKGTVIATIRPDGILVEANGKKFLAKHPIAKPTQALATALEAIPFDGDGKKFAQEALRLVKKAEEQAKTDSGKHEGKVTNDPETPKEGKAPAGKGKQTGTKEDGVTKIPTAEQEGKNFQNDPQKPTTKKAEKIEEPKPLPEGNVHPEGHSAGGTKFQDGSTMGREQKFDADEVSKSEVSKGDASRMGNEPALDLNKFDLPKAPDKGKLGNEELEGGDRSTKGTVIAEVDEQKRKAEASLMEAKVKEARLKSASVLVADMLANGEIDKAQYSEHLERYSALPVPAIQALASSLASQRERIVKQAKVAAQAAAPGMSLPVVVQKAESEKSLKDKLVSFSSLTRKCDAYDEMKGREQK